MVCTEAELVGLGVESNATSAFQQITTLKPILPVMDSAPLTSMQPHWPSSLHIR